METRRARTTGAVTLAALGAGVIGLWNLMSGIAAVAEDDVTERLNEVLFGIDITVWGWVWIVIGAIQIITAVLIYQRSVVGQALGMGWAIVSASLAVFLIFVAPIWALTVVAVNLAVIWALSSDEFREI